MRTVATSTKPLFQKSTVVKLTYQKKVYVGGQQTKPISITTLTSRI